MAEAFAAWESHGYAPPQKPAQAVVHGRDGSWVSGATYRAAISAIRWAAAACAKGDVEEAERLARSALARLRTGESHPDRPDAD